MLDPKLYSLLQVNESGSFIAASRKLSITQPAVSQHIKALEEELGVTIFDRHSGRVILTREGEEVVKCAKKMQSLYENLKQNLRDSKRLVTHLTVGVTHTAESNPIAEALARYCAENDKVIIKMITGTISNLYTKLKEYEIDLAVVEGRITEASIHHLLMDTDYLVLAVSVNHPFARREMVTLNELKRERMILRLPNSGTRNLFVAHLESNNMSLSEFNVILELDNIATIKDLIRRDFGVSILPRSVCLDELKKKKIAVLPVENLSMIREINLAYHKDFSQLDILQDIANFYGDPLRLTRGPRETSPAQARGFLGFWRPFIFRKRASGSKAIGAVLVVIFICQHYHQLFRLLDLRRSHSQTIASVAVHAVSAAPSGDPLLKIFSIFIHNGEQGLFCVLTSVGESAVVTKLRFFYHQAFNSYPMLFLYLGVEK